MGGGRGRGVRVCFYAHAHMEVSNKNQGYAKYGGSLPITAVGKRNLFSIKNAILL